MTRLATLVLCVCCGAAPPSAAARAQAVPCAGERRIITVTEGTIAALQATLVVKQKELAALAGPAQRLAEEASALAEPAQRELVTSLLVTGFRKLAELVVRLALHIGANQPGYVQDIQTAVDLVELGDVGDLLDLVPFWKEMTGYFDLLHGAFQTDLDAVERYAAGNDVPLVKRFLEKLGELEGLRDNAGTIANRIKAIRQQILEAEETLKQQRQDLAACLAGRQKNCSAELPPALLATMSWSEWQWTVREESDSKSLNVAFGGHGKSRGTSHSDTTITATVRATSEAERDKVVFGRATGRFVTHARGEFVYADGFKEPYDVARNNPLTAAGDLRLRASDGRGLEYQIVFKEVTDDRPTTIGAAGEACNGDFSSQSVLEQGRPNDQIWSKQTGSWTVTITAVDPPPHVPLVAALPAESTLDSGVREFTSRLGGAVSPLIPRLSLAGRYQESARLGDVDDIAGDWFRNQGPSRDDYLARADIREIAAALTGFWLSSKPGADSEYAEALAGLRPAIARWQAVKRLVEDRLAAAAADAQALVGPEDPAVIRELQALVEQLRRKGIESFARKG